MKILVTGGAGFIGSHIVEHHLAKGDEVFVVDDLSTGKIDNIATFLKNPKFNFEQADILTWDGLLDNVSWADRIYHMAAAVGMFYVLKEKSTLIRSNIGACDRLYHTIAESRSSPLVLLASTSEVYGHSQKKILSEEDNMIIEPGSQAYWNYAISKLADETIADAYKSSHNIRTITIRFFNVIGPRQSGAFGMVVPRFVSQACSGNPIVVYGDGKQNRTFTDVRDVVVALDKLAENSESFNQIVNVGSDHQISIKNLAGLVKKLAKSNSKIVFMPYSEAYGQTFHDIMSRRPDLNKFNRLSNYKIKWSLEDTLKDLIQDFYHAHPGQQERQKQGVFSSILKRYL